MSPRRTDRSGDRGPEDTFVLPAPLREQEAEPGRPFAMARAVRGDFRVVRTTASVTADLPDWLLASLVEGLDDLRGPEPGGD